LTDGDLRSGAVELSDERGDAVGDLVARGADLVEWAVLRVGELVG
jgi:hypothetical protein